MKRLLMTFLFTLLIVFGASFTAYGLDEDYYKNSGLGGTTLNVYNWGEYISDGSEDSLDVNKYFEELTGIKINYTNFDSNEDMYAKIKSGGASYDVVFPSDYMIERMISEGLLEKLDYSKLPNYSYIDDRYKGLYYDPDEEYTAAYNVGYVALIYNTRLVDEPPTSWSAMWDPKYEGQVLTFNNPRDCFALAQLYLGQSLNTTDPDDWALAFDKLKKQKHIIKSYVMDEIFNIMERGGAAMAPYYVGDYISMADNNPDLAIAFPKEGTNIFVDAMCVPTTCQNKAAAELYINFMMESEIALANAEYICYATPNTAVLENDEYSLKDNEILYPDADILDNMEYYHNLPPETLTLMTNYWSDLKVEGDSNTSVYIGLISFTAIVIVYAVYRAIKKKRRERYYD